MKALPPTTAPCDPFLQFANCSLAIGHMQPNELLWCNSCLVVVLKQQLQQCRSRRFIILHQQNVEVSHRLLFDSGRWHRNRGRRQTYLFVFSEGGISGSSIENVAPLPLPGLDARIEPECNSTSAREIANPSPKPPKRCVPCAAAKAKIAAAAKARWAKAKAAGKNAL